MNPIQEDILMHYGVKRRSGRYPWGSGDNPYQHGGDFLSRVEELQRLGKSEKEILESLGDPRLIAKTIIDIYQGPEKEVRMEYDQETGRSPEYHHVNMNTWYSRLLTFVIIGLILIVVFTFLSWILPILLPVILVVWFIRLLLQRR